MQASREEHTGRRTGVESWAGAEKSDRLLIRTSARPPGIDDAETVAVDAHAVLLVQAVVAAGYGGDAGTTGLRCQRMLTFGVSALGRVV